MAEHRNAAQHGPLSGLRVVEWGPRIAAPLVGMLLADQGAEVVRIVAGADPAADPVLDAMFARGKTELALDPTRPAGHDTLRRLLTHADVFIDDLPPGLLARLGIDVAALAAGVNPGLIHCRLAPFAAGDPRSVLPRHEAVAGTAGWLYVKPFGPPAYHDFPLGSVMAGIAAANAVAAALFARLATGRGQTVDTTLHHANLFAQVLLILMKTGIPRGFLPLKMVATPFMGSWRCQDDRYVYLHITLPAHNAQILETLEKLGHHREVAALRATLSDQTKLDPSQVKSIGEAKKIREIYAGIFRSRPAAEWEELLGRDLCCIQVRTVAEWVRDSLAAGMSDACEIHDPELGPLTAPGEAVTLHAGPRPAPAARVRVDDGGAALLAAWHGAPRPSPAPPAPGGGAAPAAGGPPLAGVRVLDLSRIIAGPCAARALAELGADVLSVQSAAGLDWQLSFHLLFNAGKRSVTLDLTSDEGKRTFWTLVDEFRPHAFIQNYRHLDLARQIGVDPDAVRARYPDIVYLHLNAYGNAGIWKDRPGFEQVVQAVSGIQTSYGRAGRPKLLPTPVIDIGTGMLGAFATICGLYAQRRTGQGVFATTHLTRTAVLFQAPQLAAAQDGDCRAFAAAQGRPLAPADPGAAVVGGIVRARDGFACLVGPRRDLVLWQRAAGLLGPRAPAPAEPLRALGRRLWPRSLAHWQQTIVAAGLADRVALVTAPSPRALIADAARGATGPLAPARRRTYPGVAMPLVFVRCPFDLSATPVADVDPPAVRGIHTRGALAQIGRSAPEGTGVIPYPPSKPLVTWLVTLVRWGYFAWRSGIL